MKNIFRALIFILLFSSGCYYDKYDSLYPPVNTGTCDSLGATYSGSVSAVISGYCLSCHSSAVASGGVVLDDYSRVNAYVGNGKLMGVTKQLSGYSPMPPGSQLSDCDLAKLQKWVNDGAPNN